MDNNLAVITPTQESEIKEAVLARFDDLSDTDRDALIIKIRADYEGIVQALIDSAKGLWIEKSIVARNNKGMETSNLKWYQKDPNTDVAMYLLNQLVGKPKETQIMEGRVHFEIDRVPPREI